MLRLKPISSLIVLERGERMNKYYFHSIASAVLWASTGIFIKLLDDIALFEIIWIRCFVAMIFTLLAMQMFKDQSKIKNANKKKSIFLSSLMTGYYISATTAFMHAPIALVALIIALSPCITIVFRFFLKDKIISREIIGLVLCLVGIFLFFNYTIVILDKYETSGIVFGGLLAFMASFLRALYSYILWLSNRVGEDYNSNFLTIVTFIIGTIVLFPFIYGDLEPSGFSNLDLLYFLALGVISTTLPNILNSLASVKLNPTIHSLICMTTPMIAALLAWLIFSESLSMGSIMGMFITLVGIFISNNGIFILNK